MRVTKPNHIVNKIATKVSPTNPLAAFLMPLLSTTAK
jgi:hypothetical protein